MLKFFNEVAEEAKKLEFPKKKEVYITTLIIMIIVVISSLFILLADFVISKIISLFFGL